MPFTVTDFQDLINLLAEHPEWQAALRRHVLSEDFLALPATVQELVAAQQRTEERLEALAAAQQRTGEQVRELAEAQRRTEQRVEELAEAQRRTEERMDRLEAAVERLAEAQRRTEQRVEELAEAQRRTEERMDRLEAAVERLAEAQRRTEQRVEELAEAQRRTEQRVEELAEAQRRTEERVDELTASFGRFQAVFGATVEEEAEGVLQVVLKDKGYRLLGEPYTLALDGEVDVVMPFESPTGEKMWAVVEAKARQGHRQVRGWAQRMQSSGWQQRLAAEGVDGPYLVYAFGIRIDLGAVQAAEEHGIGLLTGRGERVPPKGLIGSP